jgi:hypothetical protein
MGQVAAPREVAEHFRQAVIDPSDGVITRHRPGDVLGEQPAQISVFPAAVEHVLSGMKIVKQLHRLIPIHHAIVGSPPPTVAALPGCTP